MEPGWQPAPVGLDPMDPIDRTRRISLGQIHPARINTKILTNMITQGSGTALVAGNDKSHSETFGTSGQTVVTNLESRPSINEVEEIEQIAETELNSISDVESQLRLYT